MSQNILLPLNFHYQPFKVKNKLPAYKNLVVKLARSIFVA
jgi:hypothetical protein